MTESEEIETRDRFLHCPACSAPLQQTHQFLDPKNEKTIRLFRCERCGERIWDD